jgi:hypothetical protein
MGERNLPKKYGQLTVTDALLLPPVPFDVETLAVFDTVPQSAAVVDEVTWIGVKVVDAATVPRLHVSTWLPTPPEIVQPVYPGLTDQSRSPAAVPSAFAGRESETLASSAETSCELLTVTSKPIVPPPVTGPAGFADFETSRCESGGAEEPGSEETGADEPGSDEMGAVEPGSDEIGAEELGTDEIGAVEPGNEPDKDVEMVVLVSACPVVLAPAGRASR